MATGNKTEKPTPQRLKKAREQGRFLPTKALISGLEFAAALVILSSLFPKWSDQMKQSTVMLFERGLGPEIGYADWIYLLRGLFLSTLTPVLLGGGILLALTFATHLALTQLGFSLQRLTPKFSNFNSISRVRQLPGQNLKSVLEAVLLLTLLGAAIGSLYGESAHTLLHLPLQSLPAAALQIADMLRGLLWKAAAIFLFFGAADFFRQYRKHTSSLRMSKEEIKEEMKRNDGDPHIKNRIRRLRRELLRRQMMKEVPKATAVIVNPTHFAVAIRYDAETMSSPVCVAKGKNWLALRIRQVAVRSEVPIVENPPLARALYDAIEVGRAIPPEFYRAIAEILAYIYKMMGRQLP
jgi:flagellar biosynthesis protein FlhB